MNMNWGNDPMLSSFIEDWGKPHHALPATTTGSPTMAVVVSQSMTTSYSITSDGLLSPDQTTSDLCDLMVMWSAERKRVLSVKLEDEESFSSFSAAAGEDVDMGESEVGSDSTIITIKEELQDDDHCDMTVSETNKFHMTVMEARRYVEEQYEKIAFVPRSDLSQREKITSILAKSDCTDFSVDDVLNFDKKCLDSARACAKIVQNIPQRHRWECVQPWDIPCCYTIVADCKKVSSRDKPPRPMNAFMIWAQGARRLVNELCPKMQNALISEALGYYWRQKSDAFKLRFEQEKIKLRRFHNTEFPEYKYKPKTKVQKAKEKQELFLNKAKFVRTTVKRDKIHVTDEVRHGRSNAKSNRTKKIKQELGKKVKDQTSHSRLPLLEKSAGISPTKPTIKDMLTQKIFQDRRWRGARGLSSKSSEGADTIFDRQSPVEMDKTDVGASTRDVGHMDKNICSNTVLSSSVFDTPANTPPVDDDDDEHQQAPQPAPSSQSSTNNQTILAALQAVQLLPEKTVQGFKTGCDLPLQHLVSKARTFSNNERKSQTTSSNQFSSLTKLLFNYVTEVIPDQQNQPSTASKHSTNTSNVIDANNNNNSTNDLNNNNCNNRDLNNNTGRTTSTNSTTANNNNTYKLTNSPNESVDLDSLFLDLSAPVLSDDDLRLMLDTL